MLAMERSILIGALTVSSVLATLFYFDAEKYVLQLFEWLETKSWEAFFIFILIEFLVVALLIPGIVFTMGAGFLFGVVKGSAVVIIGTTLGASVAFLLSRYLFVDKMANYLLNHPTLKVIDNKLASKGWRFVLLTRMVPFFPFKLSNYFFGLTRFRLPDFIIGTAIGIIPITVINVYMGSLAASMATLESSSVSKSPMAWGLYGVGFLVAIFFAVYLTREAKKILENQLKEPFTNDTLTKDTSTQDSSMEDTSVNAE